MTDAREKLEKAITHALTEFCEERMTEGQVQHHVLTELYTILDAMPEDGGWIDAGVETVSDTCGAPGPDAEIQLRFESGDVGRRYHVKIKPVEGAE
jgi:hypothetical protein